MARQTGEFELFIESSDSRETSREIMKAIAAFASSLEEAEEIWENGLWDWDKASKSRFVAIVTGDGRRQPSDFCWGASGSRWANNL